MALKENKKFTLILAVALLAVWGAVGYRVATAVWGSNDEDTAIGAAHPVSQSRSEEFHYDVKMRDPFAFMPVAKRDTIKAKPKLPEPIPWSPPPFKLIGIIIDKSKKTAVLEQPDGETRYVSERDTLVGLRVLAIEKDAVTYQYDRKKAVWKLSE